MSPPSQGGDYGFNPRWPYQTCGKPQSPKDWGSPHFRDLHGWLSTCGASCSSDLPDIVVGFIFWMRHISGRVSQASQRYATGNVAHPENKPDNNIRQITGTRSAAGGKPSM